MPQMPGPRLPADEGFENVGRLLDDRLHGLWGIVLAVQGADDTLILCCPSASKVSNMITTGTLE